MCHRNVDWSGVREELSETGDTEANEATDDATPSFLNEEASDDLDVLTDGGDEA